MKNMARSITRKWIRRERESMARNLEELKKQYNSVSHGESLRGGGPGNRHGHRAKGKPKDIGKTVGRLLSYVGKYKFRSCYFMSYVFGIFFCVFNYFIFEYNH